MKYSIIKKAIIVAAATLALTSCKDWLDEALDIEPSDRYSPGAVWSSEANADRYLLGLYNFIKEIFKFFSLC